MVRFTDGLEVVLPLSYQRYLSGGVRRYILSPPEDITYGGWISPGVISPTHAEVLKNFILNKYKNLYWRLNPYDDILQNIFRGEGETSTTDILELNSEVETIFKKFRTNCRNAVNQAIQKKVSVRMAENESDWKKYYRIYQDTVNRWGSKALHIYTYDLFQLLFRASRDNVNLWLARYNGRDIAGLVTLGAHSHVYVWHSAIMREYLSTRAVNLLYYKVIDYAIENSYKWFDFGPSGGLTGVKKFKKSFGTVELQCNKIRKYFPLASRMLRVIRKTGIYR